MKAWRVSVLELLFLTALSALAFAFVGSLYRATQRSDIIELTSSHDGRWCAAVYQSGRIHLWDTSGDVPLPVACSVQDDPFLTGLYCPAVQWLKDGRMVVMRDFGSRRSTKMLLHDPATNQTVGRHNLQIAGVDNSIAISPDAKWLIDLVTSSSEPVAHPISIDSGGLRIGPGSKFERTNAFPRRGRKFSFTREGNFLVGFGDIWSVFRKAYFITHATRVAEFTPDGRLVGTSTLPDRSFLCAFDAGRMRAVVFSPFDAEGLTVCDLRTQRRTPVPATDGFLLGNAVFIQGDTLVFKNNFSRLETWDVSSMSKLAEGTVPAASHHLANHWIAVPRSDLIIMATSRDVTAWRQIGNKLVPQTLVSRRSTFRLEAFTIFFVVWAVAWGVLLRRRNLQEERLVSGEPSEETAATPHPVECELPPGIVDNLHGIAGFSVFMAIGPVLVATFTSVAVGFTVIWIAAFSVMNFIVLVALIAGVHWLLRIPNRNTAASVLPTDWNSQRLVRRALLCARMIMFVTGVWGLVVACCVSAVFATPDTGGLFDLFGPLYPPRLYAIMVSVWAIAMAITGSVTAMRKIVYLQALMAISGDVVSAIFGVVVLYLLPSTGIQSNGAADNNVATASAMSRT